MERAVLMRAERATGLRLCNLNVTYGHDVHAVVDLSLEIKSGGSFCLVGESAAGKSSIASAILRVLPSNATTSGDVFLGATRLTDLSEREMLEVRRHRISLVPQDARGSLIPYTRIGKQVQRILGVRLGLSRRESELRGKTHLASVGLNDVDRVWDSMPDQLSGGMCQRILLSLAVSSDPDILIADEALTSVDAPSQVELLHLMLDLHRAKGFLIMMITHDLRIASRFEMIGVLKNGRMVETGPTQQVFSMPQHAYTKCLVDAARELSEVTQGGE